MTVTNLPEIHGGGNVCLAAPLGILGLPLSRRCALRIPFCLRRGGTERVALRSLPGWLSNVCRCPVPRAIPASGRLLPFSPSPRGLLCKPHVCAMGALLGGLVVLSSLTLVLTKPPSVHKTARRQRDAKSRFSSESTGILRVEIRQRVFGICMLMHHFVRETGGNSGRVTRIKIGILRNTACS